MDKVDLHILNTAFQLIPVDTVNIEHKQLVSLIVKDFLQAYCQVFEKIELITLFGSLSWKDLPTLRFMRP